ncbi:MAG TPA: helix-turn-helix domain-containing protein [Polyangia bacterium]|nr:helix-turn-helix domain-containing protein [Polyangia bacterium]
MRERIRETTVQTILDAAEEVFADAGLHAAHMGTIAAKAGVSVGTLYNHFEDREALLAGLLVARRVDLLGKIDAAITAAATRPLRERLRGILGAFIAHCEAHRKFVHVVLQREMGRHQHTFPLAWAKKHDTMREIYDRIEDQMKRGVKERVLRSELADLGATFFFGMMRALVIREVVFDDQGGDMAVDADRLLDTFFDGMGTRKAAA